MAACALARAKLAQYVAALRESSTADKTGALVKAGYLASVKTIARNDLGNAAFGGVEYLAQRPLAVAMDYVASLGKSAATFGKVKPHEYRQIANTLNVGGLARGATGIREGVGQAVQLLRTGVDPERMMDKFDLNETTFKSPVLDKAVKFVFNNMEAHDKPFFGFALQTSLYGRARLMGIREGLTGSKLAARTNELLAAPTEEMTIGAAQDAMYATFKNPTVLSDLAGGLRTTLRQKAARAEPGRKLGYSAMQVALDLTIPFTKVASAIANAGVDYSPLGAVKGLIQAAADRNPKVQAQLMQQLSRATLGTALMTLGYSMAQNGTITGLPPANASERAQWDVEGKPGMSVKVGDTWRNITFLGPLAIPLLLGAGVRRFSGSADDTGLGAKIAYGLGAAGKTMTEQSYLQGVSNLIDALNDPTKRGAAAVAGMVPIPAIFPQITAAVDNTQRQTDGVAQKLQAKIPFASRSLPPRLTQFGDTLRRNSGGARGTLESFFDITNPRRATDTDITREMDRLGAFVNAFGRSVKVPGKDRPTKRTGAEYADLLAEFGPVKRGVLGVLLASPEYRAATDAERRDAIAHVLGGVQRTGNTVDRARRMGETVPRVGLADFNLGDDQ